MGPYVKNIIRKKSRLGLLESRNSVFGRIDEIVTHSGDFYKVTPIPFISFRVRRNRYHTLEHITGAVMLPYFMVRMNPLENTMLIAGTGDDWVLYIPVRSVDEIFDRQEVLRVLNDLR